MKPKHTPGPWSIEPLNEEHGNSYPIREKGGYLICTVWADDSGLEVGDAALIAAAPDMLAALKDMFALIDEGFLVRDIANDSHPEWTMRLIEPMNRLSQAAKVIAKAEGRQS